MRWTHDVVVVGAGAGGLTAAGGCARLGLRVALIERGRMGGECLNTGCVPSKALLASAARAAAMRSAALGVSAPGGPVVDWGAVRAHVRGAIAAIAPHDAAERFEAWGAEVIRGEARLVGEESVAVAGRTLRAKRIVLAVGSDPSVPAIEGLAAVPFLTNETVFELDALPERLVVLGGGANGVELAQAFRRLGSAVTLLEAGRVLGSSDREAAALVIDRLRAEGVAVLEGFEAERVRAAEGGIALEGRDRRTVRGSHLLIAAGRRARLSGLGLERAGVAAGPDGILVDRACRTSNRRILAIGDCRAGPRLTHAAGEEGALVVRRTGFGLPGSSRRELLPSVVYTDPELAQLGMTEEAARSAGMRGLAVEVTRLAENDRAVADGDACGWIKRVGSGRRVLGVTIVGRGAGELLLPWSLALAGRASPWAMSGVTVAYPTRSEISKAAAFAAFEGALFGRQARRWAGLLARIRR